MRKKPVVFLDRDGVINCDSYDYVKSWDEFNFRPDALASVRRLHEAGLEVYVITNQSGVGRGYYSERTLLSTLSRMMIEISRAGGMVHGFKYCPHSPDDGCMCRKPKPGMLLRAAAKWGIDLPSSVFVGDSCGDVNAAHAAGCSSIFLTTRADFPFREGYPCGADQVTNHLERCEEPPDAICDSLADAVDHILTMPQFSRPA